MRHKESRNDKLDEIIDFIESNNLSKTDKLFKIKVEMSDIIFEQHRKGCYITDAIIIGVQLLLVVTSVMCSFFGLHISNIICSFTLILLALVMLNNIVHDIAWRNAKSRLKKLDVIFNLLQEDVED